MFYSLGLNKGLMLTACKVDIFKSLGAIETTRKINFYVILCMTRNPAPSRTAFSKKWHLENGNSTFKVEFK